MNVDIKPRDCQFYVDEEKRKVICVIPNTAELFFNYIEDFSLDVNASSKFWTNLLMPHRFTGVATCSPEDTFDEETGRLIAFNKAKRKLNSSFFKRAQTFVNYIDDKFAEMIESFNTFGERLSNTTERRENKINELLKVNEKV